MGINSNTVYYTKDSAQECPTRESFQEPSLVFVKLLVCEAIFRSLSPFENQMDTE